VIFFSAYSILYEVLEVKAVRFKKVLKTTAFPPSIYSVLFKFLNEFKYQGQLLTRVMLLTLPRQRFLKKSCLPLPAFFIFFTNVS